MRKTVLIDLNKLNYEFYRGKSKVMGTIDLLTGEKIYLNIQNNSNINRKRLESISNNPELYSGSIKDVYSTFYKRRFEVLMRIKKPSMKAITRIKKEYPEYFI